MRRFWTAYLAAYRGLPPAIWWLSLVLLVNRSGTMVLTFLALYVTDVLGYGIEVAGWLLATWGAGHLTGSIAGGWLTDRVGPLPVQVASLALSGLGFVAIGWADRLTTLAALVFFTAVAAESFRPANGAALAAMAPDHLQTRAVALNRMALNLGVAVGPALGGWLALRSYSLLYFADGGTCLLAAALLLGLIRGGKLPADLTAPPIHPSDQGGHPLSDRPFLAFLGLSTLLSMIFLQGWAPFAVYLKEVYGINEAGFGLLMTLNAALICGLEVPLTHRTEHVSPLRIFGLGAFLLALGLAILPLGRAGGFAVLSVLIWTVGEMLAIPAAGGWVALRASAGHRGKYMGLYTMAWGLAWLVGPPLGTWVYGTLGPDTLWYGVGGLGLATLSLSELLRRGIEGRTTPVRGQPCPHRPAA